MHLQPVFKDCPAVGGRVAERLFENGLCLPSGSSLEADQQARVIDVMKHTPVSIAPRVAVAHG